METDVHLWTFHHRMSAFVCDGHQRTITHAVREGTGSAWALAVGRDAFIPKNLRLHSPCPDPVLESLAFKQLSLLRGLQPGPAFLRDRPEGLALVVCPPNRTGNQRR